MAPRMQVVEHITYLTTDVDPVKKGMFTTLERIVAPKGSDAAAGVARLAELNETENIEVVASIPDHHEEGDVQTEEDIQELDQTIEWKHTDVSHEPNGQFQEVIEEGEVLDNAHLLHHGEVLQLNEIRDGEELEPEVFLHSATTGQFYPLQEAHDLENVDTAFVEVKEDGLAESAAGPEAGDNDDNDPLAMLAAQFSIKVISEGQEDRQHAVEPENSEMSDRERRIRSMITTEDVDWADLMKSHKVVSSKDAD